jgi:hypothetical protein
VINFEEDQDKLIELFGQEDFYIPFTVDGETEDQLILLSNYEDVEHQFFDKIR